MITKQVPTQESQQKFNLNLTLLYSLFIQLSKRLQTNQVVRFYPNKQIFYHIFKINFGKNLRTYFGYIVIRFHRDVNANQVYSPRCVGNLLTTRFILLHFVARLVGPQIYLTYLCVKHALLILVVIFHIGKSSKFHLNVQI